MSDTEEDVRSDEEGVEDSGPSEAQLAMQRRRQQQSTSGLDDDANELLENNKVERGRMEEEINELRRRSEQRKKERKEEEIITAERRAEEEARRKGEEEERKRKKTEEEDNKRAARAAKMAEFEKWKNPPTRNFVINKKDRTGDEDDEEADEESEKKSKEQLEAEKRAILKQRIQPLDTAGLDSAKLSEKAKELHALLYRLESERYDLERRFKAQQYDMMDLAERARSMNKVGKQGSIKRIQICEDENDKMQERFAGCPAKIVMYSEYERQKDKRDFGDRRGNYTGPVYGFAAERIKAQRIVKWNEEGMPLYEEDQEGGAAEEVEAE